MHRHRFPGLRTKAFVLPILTAGMIPAIASAEVAPAPERAIYKTATYQGLSSLNDFLFGLVFAGGAAAGRVLALTSTVTEPVTYYMHERVWDGAQAIGGNSGFDLVPLKTATYTAVNMGRIFVTGVLVTGSLTVATGYVAYNAVADAVTYAANDLTWHAVWPTHGRAPVEDVDEEY